MIVVDAKMTCNYSGKWVWT